MGRKRRKVKNDNNGQKPLPDADPNSENFMYDEVDKFHRNKDKIMLDTEKEAEEESDVDESDPEEVLGVEESSEESDEEEDDDEEDKDEMDDSDLDTKKEKELPSDKAWGRSKKAFYDADVEDADIYASDEEAELAAQEEEMEALTLQKRMAERLDEDDFLTIDKEEAVSEQKDQQQHSKVTKDLSKLSKREKLELVNKESPELLPLINEYQECMKELKDYYSPLLKRTFKKGEIKRQEYVLFIQTKHQLLMNYLVNISFYLALKASKEDLKTHPIIDVLWQHKQLLSEMKPMHKVIIQKFFSANGEEQIQAKTDLDIKEIIRKSKSRSEGKSKGEEGAKNNTSPKKSQKVSKKNKDEKEQSSDSEDLEDSVDEEVEEDDDENEIDPLAYYKAMKQQVDKKKKKNADMDELEGGGEEIEEYDENDKRKITYEMAKNRGLIRHRRKELRNPRVKHKMKFKKAKIKRKGQVREVQNELSRYGGESTGIKSTLTRSVRIK